MFKSGSKVPLREDLTKLAISRLFGQRLLLFWGFGQIPSRVVVWVWHPAWERLFRAETWAMTCSQLTAFVDTAIMWPHATCWDLPLTAEDGRVHTPDQHFHRTFKFRIWLLNQKSIFIHLYPLYSYLGSRRPAGAGPSSPLPFAQNRSSTRFRSHHYFLGCLSSLPWCPL